VKYGWIRPRAHRRLFADPARARILRTLIDGTLRPAGELAFAANISAQSASAHLAKLVDGGLLELQAQGRHRYFRIANPEVADAVESLGSLGEVAAAARAAAPALRRAAPAEFLRARTCYDHLAGETAVQVCAAMLEARWLAAEGRDFR
jgi:DNA-binding transcriptional ArsR family regulator